MTEAVEVDIIANDKGSAAWKAQADMVRAYLAESAKIDSTYRQNEKAARAYDAAARKAIEEGRTPLERYNARTKELKGLLDANKLSQDQFNRSVIVAKNEMDKAGQAGASSMAGLGTNVLSVVAGYASLTQGVQFFRQANEEAMKSAEDAATKIEDRMSRFQVQAGLNALEGAAAQQDIAGIAQRTATPLEQVNDIATMIVSSGGTRQAARGAGTEEIAKFVKAQGLKGSQVDAEGFTDAITRYILSQGQTPDEDNIARLVKKLQSGGIKSTKFKIPDLQHLAAIGADLKTFGMSEDEQLSQFALMGDVYGGEAHTKMRDLVQNLATVGSKPDAQPWLKKMGLKSTDIDMVGEDFPTAINTLMKGLNQLPEADRNSALKKIAEGTNIGAIHQVSRTMERAAGVKAGLSDFTEYDSDVRTMTGGRNAATIRQTNELELLRGQRNRNRDLFGRQVEIEAMKNGDSDVSVAVSKGLFAFFTSLGISPELATQRLATGNDPESTNTVSRAVVEEMKGLRSDLKEQADKPKKFEAKTDPTPASPVAAARLGA